MESRGFEYPREKSPEELREETIREIAVLLAEIIEKKDLDPLVIRNKRQKLHLLIKSLGLKGIDDPMLTQILASLYEADKDIPTPPNYPSFEDFAQKFKEVSDHTFKETDQECTTNPTLREICDWSKVSVEELQKRGSKSLEHYLYDLGKLICHRRGYQFIFQEDPITVRPNWVVYNGRHRAVALKCLGNDYIQESGIKSWVETELENVR
jgi:hypothetical protein